VAANGEMEVQAAAEEIAAALQTGELDFDGALAAANELLAESIISPEDYKSVKWLIALTYATMTLGSSPES
jgi:hypothetical protein